jgi:hypothetical protein
LGNTIAEATADGLSVMVRPLIDFLNPSLTGSYSVGDWRDFYNPANPATFFASYQKMIVAEAKVAQANGATMLSIGAEMDQLTGPQYLSYWTGIISAVRAVFSGKLTYSADWDDDISPWAGAHGLTAGTGDLATQVSFWNQLDYVGIDGYAPLSDAADPTLTQLIDGWTQVPTDATSKAVTGNQSLISYFEGVAAAAGKPLLFTELGYESATDAASQPFGSSTNIFDATLQASLYQAFFDAWGQAGNGSLAGVYFWNWDPNVAEVGPGNGANFSPQGLPAQDVVTTAFTTPAPPEGLTLSAASDSGTQGDDITNVTQPAIAGTGQVGDTVTLFDGATVIGHGTVGNAGQWSISTTVLTPGVHSLTAIETDIHGDASTASAALALTIETSTPAPSGLTLSPASDSGTQGDNTTSVADPVITGQGNPGDSVIVYASGTYDGTTAVGAGTVGGDGAWSVTTGPLTAGVHTLTALSGDAAGNVSGASPALVLTITGSAPTVPAAPSGLANETSDSGIGADGSIHYIEPTIGGHGEPGDTVTVYASGTYDGTAVVGSSTVAGDGTWSATLTTQLPLGNHTLVATQTNGGGTTGPVSAALVIAATGTVIVSGATINNPTIDSGTLVLQSGANVGGAITFAAGGTGTLFDMDQAVHADTVVGFAEGSGYLSFSGETPATEAAVIVSAQVANGNTTLIFPDHTSVTLLGVTRVDAGMFA